MRNDKQPQTSLLFPLLLGLAGMNLAAKFFYFAFLAFFVVVCQHGKLKIDTETVCYAALGVLMALYNAAEGVLSMLRVFAPCALYLAGWNYMAQSEASEQAQKRCYAAIFAVCAGAFVHFLLNFLYTKGAWSERNTNDVWTGLPMAATAQAALAVPMTALAIASLYLPRKRWYRLPMAAVLLLIVLYDLILAVRTLLVVAVVLILLGAGYCVALRPKLRFRPKRAAIVVGVLVCAAGLYWADIGGVRTYITSSQLISRFSSAQTQFWDNSLRNRAKMQFLTHLGRYPFGGLHLRARFGYAHDLLLDGYDEYGALGAALLLAVLLDGAVRMYRFLRLPRVGEPLKLTALLLHAAIVLEFTAEPILEGMPWLFCTYCLLNGLLGGMEYGQRRRLP